MIKPYFTGKKLIQKSGVHQVVANCCNCNIFPKFKIFWDPPFISFLLRSLVLFDVCTRINFMPVMFYGLNWFFLSIRSVLDFWVGSPVIFMPAIAEKNRTSSLIQVLLVSDEFFFIGSCLEIPSEHLSLRLPLLCRRYYEASRGLY